MPGWILELDRGKGIPFEGNYSQWLEAKAKRLGSETRKQAALQKQIEGELEWVRSQAKGQQKKGKSRMRRYDDLVQQVSISHYPKLRSRLIVWCMACLQKLRDLISYIRQLQDLCAISDSCRMPCMQ